MSQAEIIEAVVLTLLILIIVISLIVIFGYFIKRITSNIENLTHNMLNQKSEVLIGIKEKKVYKQFLNDPSGNKSQTISLDDFIYSLSINPESKTFRELLKLIENGSPQTQIIKKYKSLSQDKLLVTLKYSKERVSVAWIKIEKNAKDIDRYIRLQMTESFFSYKKKENFKNIFNEEIQLLDENKLYNAINKDVKSVRTKGWTLVKIENSNELIDTWKEKNINIIQMCKMRWLLKENGINAHISANGSLYFVKPGGRSSNHFTVKKEWNNKILSLLDSNKQYYFDVTKDEIRVTTSNDIVKDNKSINKGLMTVGILSESTHQERSSKTYIKEVWERVDKIHQKASELVKTMKEGQFPIKSTEYDLAETNSLKIVEYYLDMQLSTISEIVKYSFMHKKDIIQLTFSEASKRTYRFKNKIGIVMFDMKNLSILSSISKKVPARENFLLAFVEDGVKYSMEEMNKMFSILREDGHRFMQFIRDIEDGLLKIHLSMKPDYVFLTKSFGKIHDEKESINKTLIMLKTIKDKNVKILSVK